MSNEYANPAFGIVDASWPMRLKEAGKPCEDVYLEECKVRRNKDTGVVFPFQDAEFAKKYGYGVSTVRRARNKLLEKKLLFLVERHSNQEGSANSYRLPEAVCFNEHRAKRKAANAAKRLPKPRSTPAPWASDPIGARPSQDPISEDLPKEQREASLKFFRAVAHSLPDKTPRLSDLMPPIAAISTAKLG